MGINESGDNVKPRGGLTYFRSRFVSFSFPLSFYQMRSVALRKACYKLWSQRWAIMYSPNKTFGSGPSEGTKASLPSIVPLLIVVVGSDLQEHYNRRKMRRFASHVGERVRDPEERPGHSAATSLGEWGKPTLAGGAPLQEWRWESHRSKDLDFAGSVVYNPHPSRFARTIHYWSEQT